MTNALELISRNFGSEAKESRLETWIWYTLERYGSIMLETYIQSSQKSKETIKYALSRSNHLTGTLTNEASQGLLPEKYFNWLNEGKRQETWIYPRLLNITGRNIMTNPINVTGRDLQIALIDLWPVNIEVKHATLQQLELQWNLHKKGDSLFKWFKDDPEKCNLAWEWIISNAKEYIHPLERFEDLESLLTYFDSTPFSNDHKKYYIDKIKARWRQNKHRKNLKGKSQYNFIISDKSITKLDKLVEKYGGSRAKILEILIEIESEKNDHIPEKLKLSALLSHTPDAN
ncbi:hypothetical protein SD209_32035 [Pseudomonas aeruginosa]|uniref:hypothetical protein n=1 Tax=Pseudomonas aeruginosa TaxID=287 RepID=UPI00298FDABE|nr:hypothetical protein [Pseudomonas aeruginosa]WPD44463.1 hypothetical protein SD209_32035 [Pseudomonas aeruginosa]